MMASPHEVLPKISQWVPSNQEEYSAMLSFLSDSKKRWAVTDAGKIAEIHPLLFILEKFKGLIGGIDHSNKKLVAHHLLRCLSYGQQKQLLHQQDEKIQKIAQRMGWSFTHMDSALQEISDRTKTPLEFKIDHIHRRFQQFLEREKATAAGSCSRVYKQWQAKFDLGLLEKEHLEKIKPLFEEFQKEQESKIVQAEEMLQRAQNSPEYLTELCDHFEKFINCYEEFFLKLKDVVEKTKIPITWKYSKFRNQVLLEKGLLSYLKGIHPIDAYIESPLAKDYIRRETLLHSACFQRDLPLVQWLLKRGANPNVINSRGASPLSISTTKKSQEIALLLIENGANVHFANRFGDSQAIEAVVNDNFELLKKLVEKGVNLNQSNINDTFPLRLSLRFSPESVNYLVEKGAKVDELIPKGITCQHIAYFSQRPLGNIPLTENKGCVEYQKRAYLANFWTLDYKSQFQGHEVKLEGGFGRVGIKEIIKRFSEFQELYLKGPSFECIKKALNQKSLSYTDLKECMRRFKEGETMLFDSGYPGHLISILYFGDYLLILNRAAGFSKDTSIYVQKIDRTKAQMRENHWYKLLYASVLREEADLFFYKTLPAVSGGQKDFKDPIIDTFNGFLQNYQKMGNCWIVSPKLFPLALFLISEFIKIKERRNPSLSRLSSFFLRRELKKTLNKAYKEIYKPFTTYLRLHCLKVYLQHVIESREKFGKESIEPDHALIKVVMHKYHAKYSRKCPYYKDLENEINQLYQKYLPLFDQAPISTISPHLWRIARQFKPKIHLSKRVARNTRWIRPLFLKLKSKIFNKENAKA